jgi:hypothetical protein
MSAVTFKCNLFLGRKWSNNIGLSTDRRIGVRRKLAPSPGDKWHQRKDRPARYAIDDIAHLEVTALVGNTRAFENVLDNIKWLNRPASDFIRVIDLALQIGAYTSARRIVELALGHHLPQDETLQRYSAVLAAPVVTQRAVQFDPSIRANRDWLRAHGDEYRGKWIGLRNGDLVGAADSYDTLINMVGDDRNILVTQVY